MPRTRSKAALIQDASETTPSTSEQSPEQTPFDRSPSLPPLQCFGMNHDHKSAQHILTLVVEKREDSAKKKKTNKKRKRSTEPYEAEEKVKKYVMSLNVKRCASDNNVYVLDPDYYSGIKNPHVYSLKVPKSKNYEELLSKKDEIENIGQSKGGNFINVVNRLQRGLLKPSILDEIGEQLYLRDLRWFEPFSKEETIDLRITAMAWHPTNPHLLFTGGKAGTVLLKNVKDGTETQFIGLGPGGTIEAIRFNTKRTDLEVYTASIDGTLTCFNFDSAQKTSLVTSEDTARVWFCAMDIHQDGKTMFGGDSMGNIVIHHLDNGRTESREKHLRLHASKIRHLEFSPRDPNLMVTSSLDKFVKLWDIRKLNGKESYVSCFENISGVSAAKFSRTDGCRLLTTDLHSELKVYKAPLWTIEHKIAHPHRHFQHLTIIKASWHPRADIFVVGRYPNPEVDDGLDDLRSVDVFSASSGRLCHELMNDSGRLITSLAEFNCTGNRLASTSGRTFFVWKSKRQRYIAEWY